LTNHGRTFSLIDTRARNYGYLRETLLIDIQLDDFEDEAGVAEVVFHGDAITGSKAALIEGERPSCVVAEVQVTSLADCDWFKASTLHRAKGRKVVQAQAAIKQCHQSDTVNTTAFEFAVDLLFSFLFSVKRTNKSFLPQKDSVLCRIL
jgi:hypothetical protein